MWPSLTRQDFDLTTPFQAPLGSPSEHFVFFDVGSVMIDLDWDSFISSLAQLSASPQSFHFDEFFKRFYSIVYDWNIGSIGPGKMAALLREGLGYVADGPGPSVLEIKHVWSLIVGSVRLRSVRLIRALREKGYGVGVLSNANPWHEADILKTVSLYDHFDIVLFSHDLLCEKPEPLIYRKASAIAAEFVNKRTNGRSEIKKISFVDDLPANVTAAQNAGWDARLVALLSDTLKTKMENGQLEDSELKKLSVNSGNLIFGDAAARKVEALFKNFSL